MTIKQSSLQSKTDQIPSRPPAPSIHSAPRSSTRSTAGKGPCCSGTSCASAAMPITSTPPSSRRMS